MSFPRYAEYRDSGVEWLGDVPCHWKVLDLKHACEVFPSNVDKHSRDDEKAVRLCNYTDVYYNERITARIAFMEATASEDQIVRFTLRAGDTIITKDSETADDIAIAAYVPAELPGVLCGYHLSMVRPRKGTVGSFVKWALGSAYAKASFAVAANGLTRVGLGQYEIDNLALAFPPIAEQEALAAFLDHETAKIDALIAEQERLIALLKEKRQAVISQAVTKGLDPSVPMKDSGVECLGQVPAHWPVMPIKRALRSIEQGWSPQCEGGPALEGQWGVMKVGCVNGGMFDFSENKALPPMLDPMPDLALRRGDVLVSRANTRELVGSAALVPTDYPFLMLCDKLYRLRTATTLDPEFLVGYLGSSSVRSLIEAAATGASSSMLNVGQAAIAGVLLAVPPASEQAAILAALGVAVAKIDALTAEPMRLILLLRERRSALISAAVTGEIDVRGVVAPRPEAALA